MLRHRVILMISTCGTSLLTNEAEPTIKKLLRDTANHRESELSQDDRSTLDTHVAFRQGLLHRTEVKAVRGSSAELNGLLGYYNGTFEGRSGDQHVLLHTDTYQGIRTAEVLEDFLRARGITAMKQTFPGLRTDTVENFQNSIVGLIAWCEDTLPGYQNSRYHIVFNLTGGFKSVQGWMQTLGMFYADEIVYIFESGRELLRIPRIPVAIDDGVRKVVEQYLDVFRRLAVPHTVCKTSELAGIPETFFCRVGDESELSPWGKLVWGRLRKTIYGEKLHPPVTDSIQYAEKFKKAVDSLPNERLVILNERIDDLTGFLGNKQNPNRLDFKQLRGNPRPPSTHECDAWSDGAAWRVFAHFAGERLVLDDLGEGFHS